MAGQFWAAPEATTIRLTGEALARKQAAAAAYGSQSGVVAWFDLAREAYRPAPQYDFARRPPPGRCLYERKGFMQSADWRARAAGWVA